MFLQRYVYLFRNAMDGSFPELQNWRHSLGYKLDMGVTRVCGLPHKWMQLF